MTTRPVLIVSDAAERVKPGLEQRFPDLEFACAGSPPEVVPALESYRPEVVFTMKHSGFPGLAHRPVVEAESVRWVQVGGSGYEHLLPFDGRRLVLTHAAGVLARFLAESTIGACLALNTGLVRYHDQQRERRWNPRRFRSIEGQTLLVVGLGAVGVEVARRARALGARVVATRTRPEPSEAADEVHPSGALHELLPHADAVSVHVRSDDSTRHLFDSDAFAKMKPGALFLNTSRGAVVDEAALVSSLQEGHLGGAYLDVFEVEPLPTSSPLWALPNVLISPHAADQVVDYPERFARRFADNLELWMAGGELIGRVPSG